MSSIKSTHARGRGANHVQIASSPQGKKARAAARRVSVMNGALESEHIAAGLGNGVIRPKAMTPWRFGAAPAHDLHPHGGLRIVGVLPMAVDMVNDTVALGGFGTAGLAPVGVNPSGAVVTGQTESLFSPTGPLAVFAQYFRHFRFRKLRLSTTSSISVADTTDSQKAVQLAYEPDIVTASQTSYSGIGTGVTERCVRFPAWTPQVDFDAISETAHTPSDELFFTTGAADSIAAAGDAEIRQAFQGAVTCLMLSVHATSDVVFATVLVEFVVDLYGFSNATTGVLPLRYTMKVSPKQALTPIEEFEVTSVDEKAEARQRRRAELQRELAALGG